MKAWIRWLAIATVVFVGAAPAMAQAVCSVTEDFESGAFPPSGWMLASTGATDSPGFQQFQSGAPGSHGAPHGGTYGAWHNDDSTTGDAVDWLVLPPIDVQGGGMTLTFWQMEHYPSYYNYHGIWVSTGSSDPADGDFVELQEIAIPASADTWEQVTVDLSPYQGQTIWLAFRYVGDWQDEWYLDDIAVDACGSGGADADLSVTKSTSVTGLVHPGDPVPFTIRVDNAGPADANNVSVTDVLPAGLEYDSCTGGCSYDSATRTVSWSVATLANGSYQEWTLNTVVAAGANGTISNTAAATADESDPDGANNQATAAIAASSKIPGIPATTPVGTALLLALLVSAGLLVLRRHT